MNEQSFDALARRAVTATSRRSVAQTLAGLTLGGAWGSLLGIADAGAKKKRKKKKKKCNGNKKTCGKKCISKNDCCKDSDCGPSGTCVGKSCACLSGFMDCQGVCIPADECCGGCPADRVCQGGSCGCPSGQYDCQGTCIPTTQCCTDASCGTGDICVQGLCVTGQGTCQGGDDVCSDSSQPRCGGGDCFCWATMSNGTRCGLMSSITGCGACTSDADCAARFPSSLGVFCIQGSGSLCECGGACVLPCAS
jgi:hypothetical protein